MGKKSKGSEGRADGPRVTVKFGNLRSPVDSSSRHVLDLVHVWSALLCYLRYTYDRRWKDFEDGRSHKVSDGSSQVTATTRSTAMGTDGASAAWKEESSTCSIKR